MSRHCASKKLRRTVRDIFILKHYDIYSIWKLSTMKKRLIVGTRASKLAMIQTHSVIALLHQQWPNLEIAIEQIHTAGDRITDLPLTQIGGDGVFVSEIERALHEKRIDLAIHSLKDLPTAQPSDLQIVIVGEREDV